MTGSLNLLTFTCSGGCDCLDYVDKQAFVHALVLISSCHPILTWSYRCLSPDPLPLPDTRYLHCCSCIPSPSQYSRHLVLRHHSLASRTTASDPSSTRLPVSRLLSISFACLAILPSCARLQPCLRQAGSDGCVDQVQERQ